MRYWQCSVEKKNSVQRPVHKTDYGHEVVEYYLMSVDV